MCEETKVGVGVSMPLPTPNLRRMIWQPVTEAGEDAPKMRLAPMAWQSSLCHHALEHLVAENDAIKATLSALQEQNKALREALEVVAYMGHDAPMTWSGTELDWANRRAGMMQNAARKALAATKQEGGE